MVAASGLFIAVEGIEGVGKTTNMNFIAEWLAARDIDVVQTREPGGTELAEEIRHTLLQPRTEPVADLTELLLVFAARAQHLETLIKPALAAGKWVLSDRFTDATYAYQGGGRGLPEEQITILEQLVQRGLTPDAVLLLDMDPVLGMQRARQRSDLDRIEQQELAFFQRVREAYQQRAAAFPKRYHIVDASRELAVVQQHIADVLENLLDHAMAMKA